MGGYEVKIIEVKGGFLDDADWVRRTQSGDRGAYDELVRRHQRAAIRVATTIAGAHRAPDAAQEGFVRAYRSLDQFDPNRPFRPWLLRIVANAAKNELRSSARHLRLVDRAGTEPIAAAAEDDPAVRAEQHDQIFEALTQLRTDDRLIIALRWFEDLSEREIAEVLDIRPGTVKSRLSRAMARLRAELPESRDDD